MSGETVTLREYLAALRNADQELATERDRRYAEVNVEKEKALKIKETADLAALQLAREIQTYKDEKANELREQISSERGLYATKDDLSNVTKEITATIKPLVDYVSAQQGGRDTRTERRLDIGALLQFLGLVAVAVGLYIALHK